MDLDTYDPANPYFMHDVDKLCAICTRKLELGQICSLNKPICGANEPKAYQVLESISHFKHQEDGPQSMCSTCFQNTTSAYRFQQICNKSQRFFEKYCEHQQQFETEKSEIEETHLEEVVIQISEFNDKNIVEPEELQQVKIKSKDKKVPCKVCHKSLKAENIRVHMRIHTGERPYKCKYCEASFNQWASLKYHTDRHENKRNYICRYCGKAMASNSHLRAHERIHTGERPHPCKHCELAFHTKKGLHRHSVVHTNEKPFTCEYCAKSFNRRSTLCVHLKIHTGERPHVCSWCGKSFIQFHCLKSHLQMHAKNNMQDAVKFTEEASKAESQNEEILEAVNPINNI